MAERRQPVDRTIIYFICTGNSARSQMAEGIARKELRERFEVVSGGLEPSFVNPLAIEVMREIGIDISGHQSKPIDPERLNAAGLCITLCGHAEERCPLTPPAVARLHWPLTDPASAVGSHEEKIEVFRRVRDEIRERVRRLANDL